jgi:hypothetical protein
VRIGQNKKFAITTLLRALHNFPDATPQASSTSPLSSCRARRWPPRSLTK